MTENCVFIRNLSPLANRDSVIEVFSDLREEILSVEFHKYSNSEQKFCQICFKSSKGVTRSTAYNGSTLLGVPMSITVLPPVQINNCGQSRITSSREVFVKGVPGTCSDEEIASLFGLKDAVPVKIKKLESSSSSRADLIIEFASETTAQRLLELGGICTENGDLIEISDRYLGGFFGENDNAFSVNGKGTGNICSAPSSLSTASPAPVCNALSNSGATNPTNFAAPGLANNVGVSSSPSRCNSVPNAGSIDLSNISVPLAYQQIKKVEWDRKLSKVLEIKKSIEKRILNSDSKLDDGIHVSRPCSRSGRGLSRRSSLSRSLSPAAL
ncbi:RRM (2xRRMs) domaincontaining protein [Cryptosporidium ryanae]|uniref:RRM (2xRRMs) domaincontaining protein n=1 Tax=Cryptosporidium ryanae TaxID=515981 RepID=UPI00351AA3CC|nr:RRM (2xRRMs) domaincontaining protein [Cryptosporidium ryanae]